jgi:hypothetical protein
MKFLVVVTGAFFVYLSVIDIPMPKTSVKPKFDCTFDLGSQIQLNAYMEKHKYRYDISTKKKVIHEDMVEQINRWKSEVNYCGYKMK